MMGPHGNKNPDAWLITKNSRVLGGGKGTFIADVFGLVRGAWPPASFWECSLRRQASGRSLWPPTVPNMGRGWLKGGCFTDASGRFDWRHALPIEMVNIGGSIECRGKRKTDGKSLESVRTHVSQWLWLTIRAGSKWWLLQTTLLAEEMKLR